MTKEVRNGSIVVRESMGNMEILAAHQGGIVHGGRVIIERNDMYDLFTSLREFLLDRICLECGANDPACQCWNDE